MKKLFFGLTPAPARVVSAYLSEYVFPRTRPTAWYQQGDWGAVVCIPYSTHHHDSLPPDVATECCFRFHLKSLASVKVRVRAGGRKMQPESIGMVPQLNTASTSATAVLQEVERRIGTRNFSHWFRSSTTCRVHGDVVAVGVGSPFLLAWMQKQFRADVSAAAQAVLGPSAGVRFEVDSPSTRAEVTKTLPVKSDEPVLAEPKAAEPKKESPKPVVRKEKSATPGEAAANVTLTPGRRFASLADFVEGTCNRLPMAAALKVCESPGLKYNPLYLHGSVGTGKTHLLEGIYGRLRRQFPSLNVLFLTAEAFANYFTEALREHKLPAFRRRFRGVDVLLVDDVNFLSSKRVIQEEFLHTVKQLESHGRQVVVTADCHPRLLTKVSDELTTRFLSGMVCRVECPDRETRKQIVESRAARLDAEITPEACGYVAQRFTNNVRELIGALNCLETYYHLTRQRVGLSAARHVLADLERDCVRVVRMADVEQTVCRFFGIEADDLKSSRRDRTVSQPRMLAMFLARKHTHAAYREIGKYFGGRNHSTVKAAEQRVSEWIAEQSTMRIASQSWSMEQLLAALEQQLQAG